MDVQMFESANLPWRRPGSDVSDWFNYGFDEVSWRTFLGYRNEMERGREQMVSCFGWVGANVYRYTGRRCLSDFGGLVATLKVA